jgi:hypothetical protein
MIALRAPSIQGASSQLGLAALPTPIDAATLADAAATIATMLPETTIAWSMPIVAPGMLRWALARMRRVRPVQLEDACEALRHAGVLDVRVTTIEGALPSVVLTGRTTGGPSA